MRIGIIGAGAVARYHVMATRHLPDVAVTAICDLSSSAAERAAAECGAVTFSDYRALYESGEVDAVIVNTPHNTHAPMMIDAAAAGLHALVEKPMAITVEQCDEMIAAAAASGVALVIGQIQHFLPDKLALESVLASGVLGEVLYVHDQRTTDYRPGSRSAWFFSSAVAGGGTMMNIGSHCVDRSLWFGGARARSIDASLWRRFGSPVETDGMVRMALENGVEVTITVTSGAPRQVDEVTVVCEDGVLTANPRRGTYLRRDGHDLVLHERRPEDIQRGFDLQLADFAGAVQGKSSKVTPSHARHVVELVLAAYESAERGERVRLGQSTERVLQ